MARNESNLPVRRGEDRWLSPSIGNDLWQSGGLLSTSPWQMMRRMQEDMDRMFGHFFQGIPGETAGRGALQGSGGQNWAPSVDVSEDANEFCVEVDLPGVNKDNIEVETQNGQIRIRAEMKQETPQGQGQGVNAHANQPGGQGGGQGQDGNQRQYISRERRYGFFERVFTLPDNVKEDAINCDFRDGVLTCHIPKSAQQAQQGRRIPVGGTASQPQLQTSQAGAQSESDKNPRKKAA